MAKDSDLVIVFIVGFAASLLANVVYYNWRDRNLV